MWRSKIPQRGEAPTGILRSLAAERRRTVTDLLSAVPSTPRYLTTRHFYIINIIQYIYTFILLPLFGYQALSIPNVEGVNLN